MILIKLKFINFGNWGVKKEEKCLNFLQANYDHGLENWVDIPVCSGIMVPPGTNQKFGLLPDCVDVYWSDIISSPPYSWISKRSARVFCLSIKPVPSLSPSLFPSLNPSQISLNFSPKLESLRRGTIFEVQTRFSLKLGKFEPNLSI